MGKHKLYTDNFLVLPTAVMHEQLACLTGYGAVLFWVHTLAALFLCLLAWTNPPYNSWLLLGWLLIITGLAGFSWWCSSHFQVDKSSDDVLQPRIQRYVLITTLLHALWGTSGILLFTDQIEVVAVHSALLLLIALAALPMLLLSWPIVSVYIVTVLLPMSIMLLWPNNTTFRLLGLVLLASAVLAILATRPLFQLMNNFQNAQRRLLEQINTDALTQLANRRQFEQLFKLEWRRSARTREPLALLMLGVDQVKDQQIDDACIVALAGYLKGVIQRAGDIVARYDDYRFIVLLPITNAEEVKLLATKFRAEFERKQLICEPLTQVKVSIGAASCQPQVAREHALITNNQNDIAYPALLLKAAEDALHQAQQQGGSQTIIGEVTNR